MDIANKKTLAYFVVVAFAVVTLVVTCVLPSQLNDQSQQGIDSIKQLQEQVEVYED
jgi:hypothetical protein